MEVDPVAPGGEVRTRRRAMRGTEAMTGYTREEWIMDWLAQNWFWVVIALFVGMHFVGGGCGGHGAHGGRKGAGRRPIGEAPDVVALKGARVAQRHHRGGGSVRPIVKRVVAAVESRGREATR